MALREPAPVPFWTVLERLGLWGIYHHNPGEGRFPRLDLRDRAAWAFTSTAGPFRVSLTGLHWHRDRQLIRGPWVRIDRFGQRIDVPSEDLEGDSVTFFGGLDVMVEPRMWFTQEAPARLTEASDDLGQSLVPEAPGRETRLSDNAHFAFYAGSGVTQVRTEFRLRLTDNPAVCPASRRRPRDAPRPPSRADADHPAVRRRREDIPVRRRRVHDPDRG